MTIKTAQEKIYGRPGRGLEKKIRRAVQDGKLDARFGARDEYTDAIARFLDFPTAAELSQLEAPLFVTKDKPSQPRSKPVKVTQEVPVPHPPTRTEPKQQVFENQYLFLGMLLAICLIDGVSTSVIAQTIVGGSTSVQTGFFVAGAIVAYAGIQNAYTLSQRPRSKWEQNPATIWIILFTLYQIILHGAAGNFFGSWNIRISQALIATGLPMATAALSVLLFHSPQTSQLNASK